MASFDKSGGASHATDAIGKRSDNNTATCAKNLAGEARYARAARIESNHAQSESLTRPPAARLLDPQELRLR
ncbi:hypothetical protein AB7008_02410 [Bradyrhizobium sp. 521_C7_N1_3]|uniref:hypothetical protein n=1 Tax=Bradyrhizobium TaxID=374 RepID=UPI0027150247|nr:hypothetical protein [Bradyrhizobium japonicum]WLB53979.1 hypothetical protein QIH94_43390 [Bradyrhizobium japonicum]WLB64148.1 hypothetical protein QIH96_02400 [Bradyrhizobium japonicum]